MRLSDIKSRPIYGTLLPSRYAKVHLVAAEGEGARAVEAAFGARSDVLSRTTIVYTPGASAPSMLDRSLAALGAEALHVSPSVATSLVRLRGLLDRAAMGLRLYLSGGESFVGEAFAVGLASGLDLTSIETEHRGSVARRVQCVHCKGFTSDVVASPVTCSHCGIPLLVRDHYSRRLGAFMGVSINAEAPGPIPDTVEFRV